MCVCVWQDHRHRRYIPEQGVCTFVIKQHHHEVLLASFESSPPLIYNSSPAESQGMRLTSSLSGRHLGEYLTVKERDCR